MSEDLHPAMERFIKEVSQIVRKGGGEEAVTAQVAQRLEPLLRLPGLLSETFTRPGSDHYVMYPVYVAPDGRFSIAAAVWDVGQETPIHDHGTWGVIGIVSGTEYEIRYAPSERPGQGPPRRLGDRNIPSGEVVVCCTSDQDVHKVACASKVPCVGIHVYGADIGTLPRRTHHPETGELKTFVSHWAKAG